MIAAAQVDIINGGIWWMMFQEDERAPPLALPSNTGKLWLGWDLREPCLDAGGCRRSLCVAR